MARVQPPPSGLSSAGWRSALFQPGRARALQLLDLRAGERVLLAGVGTGADLPLLPAGVSALGIDLSGAMLARARAKLPLPGREIVLEQGDAQRLEKPEQAWTAHDSMDAAFGLSRTGHRRASAR